MKAGFAKRDITPRVGVELCGFGPFRNRHSIAVRDRLWAKAFAFEINEKRGVIIACDLLGVTKKTTRKVRAILEQKGVSAAGVMINCSHTHSGPSTVDFIGWGDVDLPYLELLPGRIAEAAIEALTNMSTLFPRFSQVPCEGIAINRCYERENQTTKEERLQEEWRPNKPEMTDTTCDIIGFYDKHDKLTGFISCFGCHPVVCSEATRYIHGDFPGVATNLIERENPGAVGLFLQGAEGDINSCIVHWNEHDSMLALDIIAARYARSIRSGLREGAPIEMNHCGCLTKDVVFSRRSYSVEELRELLAERESVIYAPGASDDDSAVRMATVYASALRRLIDQLHAGETFESPTEIQGISLGPLTLLGAPFEIMSGIKNDIVEASGSDITLVLSVTNDYLGYAPDQTHVEMENYAATTVPIMLGTVPFADIARELTREMIELEKDFNTLKI